jgi:hypothetical protein
MRCARDSLAGEGAARAVCSGMLGMAIATGTLISVKIPGNLHRAVGEADATGTYRSQRRLAVIHCLGQRGGKLTAASYGTAPAGSLWRHARKGTG